MKSNVIEINSSEAASNYRCLNLADFAIARLIGLLALLLFAALVSILMS
jgi:hypothetical protein